MAQGVGKLKCKAKLPANIKRKNKKQQKTLGRLKKGGGVIAPKKTREIKAFNLKKNLQKAINASIEQDVTVRAQNTEPKSLHVLKASDGGSGDGSGTSSKKKKK